MTTQQFNESVNAEIRRLMQQGETKPYALQVCNAGAMPESFEDWIKATGDCIDIGGNWTPDKLQSNHDQYDNERHPFA